MWALFLFADINECATTQPCEQVCTNTQGSFVCSCNDGYRPDNNGLTCSGMCKCLIHSYYLKQWLWDLSCLSILKYTGVLAYFKVCLFLHTDVDECVSNPCQHTCANTIGSYQCSCDPGFTSSGTRCIGKCRVIINIQQQKLVHYFRYQWMY